MSDGGHSEVSPDLAAVVQHGRWPFWPMAFQVAIKTGTASGCQGKNTHGQKEYLQNREGGWDGFLPSFYFPIVLFNFFITLHLGNILQTPRFFSYSDGCLSKVVSAIHSFNDCLASYWVQW